jgi:peptide deformylase
MKLSRKVLYNKARPVGFRSPWQNQKLADDMIVLMRQNRGIGLAAPQCGVSKRLFVMEIQGRVWHCFNPEIEEIGPESVEMEEGCLSFPGESCTIQRPDRVKVRYQDSSGEWHSDTLSGLSARCFQHEFDHLEGITMHQRSDRSHAE